MDFLARLDEQLREPPKPRSVLAPYFEAHLLFQDLYHTPSPSPPSSPEPESSIITALKCTQPSPQTRTIKRKYTTDDQSFYADASRKRKRANPRSVTLITPPTTDIRSACSPPPQSTLTDLRGPQIKFCPRDGITAPLPLISPESQQAQRSTASIKRRNMASSDNDVTPRTKKHCLRQRMSVLIGKYLLRGTAARMQREIIRASMINHESTSDEFRTVPEQACRDTHRDKG
jgi:hypothetical protein